MKAMMSKLEFQDILIASGVVNKYKSNCVNCRKLWCNFLKFLFYTTKLNFIMSSEQFTSYQNHEYMIRGIQ